MNKYILPVLCLMLLLASGWCNRVWAQEALLGVDDNGYTRINSIVVAKLDKELSAAYSYTATNTRTGKSAQVQLLDSQRILFILPDTLQANGSRRILYSIDKTTVQEKKPVSVQTTADGFLISVGKKPVLFYHTAVAPPPPDSPAYYARSGFIHPVYSPSGSILTDDFPAGHAHQHGVMMAWTSTQYKGTQRDFWNQQSRLGNVRHARVLSVTQGAVMATIRLELQHYTTAPDTVLTETWTIRVYPFANPFLFDIESDQVNTSRDTLFLNQYHYGGMSFRGSAAWNPDDKVYFEKPWKVITDSGFSVADGNARHAAWVAAEGDINHKYSGIAVFGFPDNFRYPQALRIHPTMPYWCYAPSVDGPFFIPPQQHYRSKFRYCVYDGPLDAAFAHRLLDDIQHPPLIEQLKQLKQ
ncbi:MAG: PmoA family protein [Williamsia sp.]|nr:PmoA family protein [Williamsia sp.]